jgi:hypothetical protein
MNFKILIILVIIFICIFLCTSNKTPFLASIRNQFSSSIVPPECDFNSPYYAPTNIKTAGDSSPVGQLIKAFVNTTLKKELASLKTMQITIGHCTSTLDDIDLCSIQADFKVGNVFVNRIQNLISNLNIAPLAQIQSFPAYPNLVSQYQNIYAVLPISFSIDIYLDIKFNSGVPVPDFNNVQITVAGCISVFLNLAVECPTKFKTLITSLDINPASKINKISLDIHNTTLQNIVNVGTFFASVDLENILAGIVNSKISDSLLPNLRNILHDQMPFTLPLPACLNVPGNIIQKSNGQVFTGLYGYRPNLYPAPSADDTRWMKCTFTCAQAGIGQYQQCLDACVDYVESTKADTPSQCQPNSDIGYYLFNDRSVVKNGVQPNGPLWRGVCNNTRPEDITLVPDISSGYSWWQSADVTIPGVPDANIPTYKGYRGVRSKNLGKYVGSGGATDCMSQCWADPNCKSFDYVTKKNQDHGEGDCYINTENGELVADNSFNHLFPI